MSKEITSASTASTASTSAAKTLPAWVWSRIQAAATHNGVLHADDGVSGAMIRHVAPNVRFIRTRDPKELAQADIVFDVGEGQFDHHGAAAGVDSHGTPWCAATRLWEGGLKEALLPNDPVAQAWFYDHALVPVALQDNGQTIPEGVQNPFAWVHYMNPTWDAYDVQDDMVVLDRHEFYNKEFERAVQTAGRIVARLLDQARAASRAQAVLEALPRDQDILEIPAGLPGWPEYVRKNTTAKFVVFEGTPDTPWYAQCVPEPEGDLFSKQVPFPAEWAGKRDVDLYEVSGVCDAVFCHVGRFITGWRYKDAALEACKKALDNK